MLEMTLVLELHTLTNLLKYFNLWAIQVTEIGMFQFLILLSEIVNPPMSMVGFAGSEVVFTCGTRNAPSVTWKINGTFFSSFPPALQGGWHIAQYTTEEIDLYTITIPVRTEYNGTLVQCIALRPGRVFNESKNATLLVQGNWAWLLKYHTFMHSLLYMQVYWLQ